MNQPVRRNAEVMAGWTQALAHNGLRLQSKGPEEKLTVGETTLVIVVVVAVGFVVAVVV